MDRGGVRGAVFLGQELGGTQTKQGHGKLHDLSDSNGGQSQPETELAPDVRYQVLRLKNRHEAFNISKEITNSSTLINTWNDKFSHPHSTHTKKPLNCPLCVF